MAVLSLVSTHALAELPPLTSSTSTGVSSYADPPPDEPFVAGPRPADRPALAHDDVAATLPPPSPFRVSVGPVGRISSHAFAPGLTAAVDMGRGPAGFRASATFVRVGDSEPLAQYGGEITLALPAFGRFVPTFGVGAALARVKKVDAAGTTIDGSANLGVGTFRAGVDVRLPFRDTDARALLGATVAVPVVRGQSAPSNGDATWGLLGASVAVGF